MTYRQPAGRTSRQIPTILVVGLLVVVAAIAALLAVSGYPLPVVRAPRRRPRPRRVLPAGVLRPRSRPHLQRPRYPPSIEVRSRVRPARVTVSSPMAPMVLRPERPWCAWGGGRGPPRRMTVFDTSTPVLPTSTPISSVPSAKRQLRAAEDGIEFFVDQRLAFPDVPGAAVPSGSLGLRLSGEGSPTLWQPPGTSAHESGDAVDLGRSDATAWLFAHGARYGLCQIYRNEPWHYELRPGAIDHGCPPHVRRLHTLDPRM